MEQAPFYIVLQTSQVSRYMVLDGSHLNVEKWMHLCSKEQVFSSNKVFVPCFLGLFHLWKLLGRLSLTKNYNIVLYSIRCIKTFQCYASTEFQLDIFCYLIACMVVSYNENFILSIKEGKKKFLVLSIGVDSINQVMMGSGLD